MITALSSLDRAFLSCGESSRIPIPNSLQAKDVRYLQEIVFVFSVVMALSEAGLPSILFGVDTTRGIRSPAAGLPFVVLTAALVSKVWNMVEKHKQGEYTSIIHGNYSHEETLATLSLAAKYRVVKNIKRQYIKEGQLEDFLEKFQVFCLSRL